MDATITEYAAPTEPARSAREERGREIAERGGIHQVGARYSVPSQSPGGEMASYLVDVVDQTCQCPDWELRRKPCKHYEAVLSWLALEGRMSADGDAGGDGEMKARPPKRPSYKQNWSAYNAAQTTEKDRVPLLLQSLCKTIAEPPRTPGPGRNRVPLRDAIFSSVMKVYTTMSGRRAASDIRSCAERGQIEKAPSPGSVFRCLESSDTTPILIRMIEEAAGPLAQIENIAGGQFAQDSTGFSTVTYDRWFDQKHGKLRAEHAWVKLHIMVGTITHVVTAAKVSSEADCPLLPELLATTAKKFKVREVSADKAYLSAKNLEVIHATGAVPFIPFKTNSVGMESKSSLWRRMYAHFSLKSDDFLARYHRRSNVETAVWMIKSKFGPALRSKLPTAQVNELLAKVLCHNLCRLVHAMTEYAIEIDFQPRTSSAPPTLTLVRS